MSKHRRSVAPAARLLGRIARSAEAVVIPVIAIIAAAALFSLFLLALGKSPVQFFSLLWRRRLRHGVLVDQHAGARRRR